MRRILCSLLLLTLVTEKAYSEPGVSAQDFITSLNLSIPELSAVRNFADHQQWDEACESYVQYLKARRSPTFFTARYDHPPIANPRPDTDWADRIANHQYVFTSRWYDLGPNIDWASNQTSGRERTLEWSATLNRHWNHVYLADAFVATGEDHYVREMLDLVDDWVTKATPPLANPGVDPYDPYWEILNVAVRAGKNWPDVFYKVISSPELSGVKACRWMRSWRENAIQLERYPSSAGNWLTHEMIGLYTIGNIFAEMMDAPRWRRFAINKMNEQLQSDFYPDGISRELAHSYGIDQFMNIVSSMDLAQLNQFESEIPRNYRESLEKMFNYMLLTTKPNGFMPNFNDSVELPSSGTLAKGFQVFPSRTDFQWSATARSSGTVPTELSHAFPYSGHYVMRSDWSDQARYVLFDGGPFGSRGHGHEDKLHFILSAYGRDLLVDPGVWFPYDDSKWRDYAVSTRGHNTILVNQQGQTGRNDPWRYGRQNPFVPMNHTWISNSQFDLVTAKHEFGYDQGIRVTHTRNLLFVKPDYWVVLDTMDPLPGDATNYTYDSLFHINANDVMIESSNHSVRSLNSDANILLMAVNPQPQGLVQITSVKGKDTEPVQGWAHINNNFTAIPTAQFRFQGTGRQRLMTLLYPLRAGQENPIIELLNVDVTNEDSSLSNAATAVEIRYVNGDRDLLLLGNTGLQNLTFAGGSCREVFCWRRISAL